MKTITLNGIKVQINDDTWKTGVVYFDEWENHVLVKSIDDAHIKYNFACHLSRCDNLPCAVCASIVEKSYLEVKVLRNKVKQDNLRYTVRVAEGCVAVIDETKPQINQGLHEGDPNIVKLWTFSVNSAPVYKDMYTKLALDVCKIMNSSVKLYW